MLPLESYPRNRVQQVTHTPTNTHTDTQYTQASTLPLVHVLEYLSLYFANVTTQLCSSGCMSILGPLLSILYALSTSNISFYVPPTLT